MFDGIAPLTSADPPTFAKARAFAEHCATLVDADGLLHAARFEPARIPKLAPYLIIVGTLGELDDFQVRLVGTRLVDEFFRADATGAKLSQILKDDEFGRRSKYIMQEVVRTKRPVLNRPGRTRLKSKDYMSLETVSYPLVDNSGTVIKIVVLYDYTFEKATVSA